jgi:hypothetical protein
MTLYLRHFIQTLQPNGQLIAEHIPGFGVPLFRSPSDAQTYAKTARDGLPLILYTIQPCYVTDQEIAERQTLVL